MRNDVLRISIIYQRVFRSRSSIRIDYNRTTIKKRYFYGEYSFYLYFLDKTSLKHKMEMNPQGTSLAQNDSSRVPTTTTTTTPVVINIHPFLQTTACQSIAGLFTWAAIFITGYHVK